MNDLAEAFGSAHGRQVRPSGGKDGVAMDRALIEHEVASMLAEMGVREERLCPTARLLQDLRIDGDDAAGFFVAIGERFGTDLTALWEDWDAHFGPEGLAVAPAAVVAAGVSVIGAAAAALTGLPALLCVVFAAMGVGISAWLVGRSGSGPRPHPIRLGEVADAIEGGRWPKRAGERHHSATLPRGPFNRG